ncbi:MAG: glycine betaine ABC transporter substrate-binding protein [Gordonia sp. (in: high G+C Gram-positive bacteria)]
MRRMIGVLLTAVMLGVGIVGCSDTASSDRTLVVGSADDPAMRVMAQIYAGALRDIGATVSMKDRAGSSGAVSDAALLTDMDGARVDLFPAFTGRLLHALAPEVDSVASADVYTDLNRSLPQGVSVGDVTPVSVAPQLFVATTLAVSAAARTLAECGRLPAGLPVVLVGAPDPATLTAFTSVGCRLGAPEIVTSAQEAIRRAATGRAVAILDALDAADATASVTESAVTALRAASVVSAQAPATGDATSTSPAAGPRAQDLVPVYRTAVLTEDEVKQVNKIAGEISTADLAALARKVRSGANPHQVAVAWLAEHGL